MNSIYESENYNISYRAILDKNRKVKMYTDKNHIEIDNDINFDLEESSNTSLNYFLASIIGGIIHNLLNIANQESVSIDEIEGKISAKLENPLTLLGVKGYENKPIIKTCEIKIYIYSLLEEVELDDFCKKTLNNCFIYNTIKDNINFKIEFIKIF